MADSVKKRLNTSIFKRRRQAVKAEILVCIKDNLISVLTYVYISDNLIRSIFGDEENSAHFSS